MVQALCPDGDGIFQDDNAPMHTAHVAKKWYEEHECELKLIDMPTQSPDFNIIKYMWCVFELQVRNRYPPPSCLKELETVLTEEWLKITLEEVSKLYYSIPRRIEALQKAGGGPTAY